jgi:hypothetical protein
MTEREWQECTDPQQMLRFLKGKGSDRQRLPFDCASERQVWHLLDEATRKRVELSEAAGRRESPFRPVALDPAWLAWSGGLIRATLAALVRCIFGNPFRPTALDPAWLCWHDSLIRRLAQVADDERQLPSGHLDPERVAVLADALEEAGCTDQKILGHLRQPGAVHVRGCHVVDLLLAKE